MQTALCKLSFFMHVVAYGRLLIELFCLEMNYFIEKCISTVIMDYLLVCSSRLMFTCCFNKNKVRCHAMIHGSQIRLGKAADSECCAAELFKRNIKSAHQKIWLLQCTPPLLLVPCLFLLSFCVSLTEKCR